MYILIMFRKRHAIFESNSASEKGNHVSLPYHTSFIMSMNICGKARFRINFLYFLSFGRNSNMLKVLDFAKKNCKYEEIRFYEIRSKMYNHYIWGWNKFQNTVWSFYRDACRKAQF